jgi:hypothetical protein
VYLWVGPANGNFSAAADWSVNGQQGVPGRGASLQFGGTVGRVTGTNTNAVDDIATLSTASVTIANNYNSTISLNNPLSATSMSIASGSGVTISGTASLSINGAGTSFNWGGGTINVSTTFAQGNPGGALTINGSDVTLNNTLLNFGTLTWSSQNPQEGPGPNINLGTQGSLRNQSGATFLIQTQ